jgi:hypothetical protein
MRHVRRRFARQFGPFEPEHFFSKANQSRQPVIPGLGSVALLKNASRRELPRFITTTVDKTSWIPRTSAMGFAAAKDPQNIEPPVSMRVRFA